jgi:hypothetical protein
VAFAGGSVSTDANPTLQANAGDHRVRHAVTDASNSKTWTQDVYVRVYDAANPPYEIDVESLSLTLDSGCNATVRVYDSVGLSTLPDGAMVCVFESAAPGSYGSITPGRSHMKVVGYLNRDTAQGDADSDAMLFEIQSPLARMAELPGFSKVFERNASPANWLQVEGLTVKRALVVLAQYYTNMTELFDLAFENFTDFDYPAFYIQKNTTLEQMKELSDSTDARLTCARTGRFAVQRRPELTALASRSGLTTTVTLADDDVLTYQFSRNHFRTVEQLECSGFSGGASGNAPLFSRYPGTPGRGTRNAIAERLIVANQSDLNLRTGRRGGALDGTFIDANGLHRLAVELEIELSGTYDVFDPAYAEWIAFSGGSLVNLRNIALSDLRFWLKSVDVTYLDGTSTVRLQLVSETNAPEARTYVPPISDTGYIDFPPFEVLPGSDNLFNLIVPQSDGIARAPIKAWVIGRTSTFKVYYAESFDAVAHTFNWTEKSHSMTGNAQWGCSDPWKYTRKFILTDTGLYKTENLYTPSDNFTLVANNATMFGNSGRVGCYIVTSINRAGWMLIPSGVNAYAVTTDYGATWSQHSCDTSAINWTDSGDKSECCRVAISPRSGGSTGYLISATRSGNDTRPYRNTGWGLSGTSWSSIQSGNIFGSFGTFYPIAIDIDIPYNKADGTPNTVSNPNAVEVWYSFAGGYLYYSQNGGQSSAYGGNFGTQSGTNIAANILQTDTSVYVAGYAAGISTNSVIYRFDKTATSLTFMGAVASLGANSGRLRAAINGWPYGQNWMIAFADSFEGSFTNNAGLYYSDDSAVTWYDITPSWINLNDAGCCAYAEFDLSSVQ